MVQHVWEQARLSGAGQVVIATDADARGDMVRPLADMAVRLIN